MIGAQPMRVGGGLTDNEKAYRAIRDAVGDGGSAPDDTGIEGLWRRSEAKGLAVGQSAERRALLQALPQFATDMLPSWERVLGIVPPTGTSDAQRLVVVVEKYFEKAIANSLELSEALAKIDPRLVVLQRDQDHDVQSYPGRWFESHDSDQEGPAFHASDGRGYNPLAAYTTFLEPLVSFELGYEGEPNQEDSRRLLRARKRLRGALASDVGVSLTTGPWYLGARSLSSGVHVTSVDSDPIKRMFGDDLSAYYGADRDSWFTDTSGHGRDLSVTGSPSETKLDGLRALVLGPGITLENADLASVANDDAPFSVFFIGRAVTDSGHLVWQFEGSPALHRWWVVPGSQDVLRTDDSGSGDGLSPDQDTDPSYRFHGHGFLAPNNASNYFQVDDVATTRNLPGTPATFTSFKIGTFSSEYHVSRLLVVRRFVTQAEAAAVRALFT